MSDGKGNRRTAAGRVFALIAPIALMAAGVVSVVYAVGRHRVEVIVPPALLPPQVSPAPVEPSVPGGWWVPPEIEEPFPLLPGIAPPPEIALPPETVPAPSIAAPVPVPGPAGPEAVYNTENEVIRETTRGGVTRTEDGQVARTYTGEPPQACPT
jgi:hypothetical protein